MRKFVMIIMAVALIALPTMAQQQVEWRSTSSMQSFGSGYTPQVNAVGATTVGEMATTTSSPAKFPGGPHRSMENMDEVGYKDSGSPVGDPLLPLLLMAFAFGGVLYLRRRQRVE